MNISEKIKNAKFLIFDFDGTIADTSPIHEKAFKEVLKPYKFEFKYDQIAGQSTRYALSYIFKKNNIDLSSSKIEQLVLRKQQLVRKKIISDKEFKPLPFVKEFIQKYQNHYLMGIASSGSRKTITIALKRLGLQNSFKHILCNEDVSKSKPSPEIYLKISSLENFPRSECLIFEDSKNGIRAAKDAFIPHIDIKIYPFNILLEKFNNIHE